MKRMLPLLVALSAPADAVSDMRGANFLQSARIPWASEAGTASLARLRATGANWVALVPFFAQSNPAACDIALAPHYDLEALRALIRSARNLGFRVALKPQMLVPGGWAGEIGPRDEAGWACWFDAYARAMQAMARLAREEGVDMLVAGTELKRAETRPEWRALIAGLRDAYPGTMSWVFHAPEDVDRFPALDLLDSVGLSLYPPLGRSAAEAYRNTAWQRLSLKRLARTLPRPLWIAEIGIPSRADAGEAPWAWGERVAGRSEPDARFQAQALYAWLEALRGSWHQGVMIWNWMSDPDAGGPIDADYTPQNKPAEDVLRCAWTRADMTECAP